jgi:hypothetical protein
VGEANQFGYPVDAAVERYAAAGVRFLRTDRDGAVTAITDGHDLVVHTFSEEHPRYREFVLLDRRLCRCRTAKYHRWRTKARRYKSELQLAESSSVSSVTAVLPARYSAITLRASSA